MAHHTETSVAKPGIATTSFVRKRMKEQKLSYRELAERSGISPNTIEALFVKRNRSPARMGIDNVFRLVSPLGLTGDSMDQFVAAVGADLVLTPLLVPPSPESHAASVAALSAPATRDSALWVVQALSTPDLLTRVQQSRVIGRLTDLRDWARREDGERAATIRSQVYYYVGRSSETGVDEFLRKAAGEERHPVAYRSIAVGQAFRGDPGLLHDSYVSRLMYSDSLEQARNLAILGYWHGERRGVHPARAYHVVKNEAWRGNRTIAALVRDLSGESQLNGLNLPSIDTLLTLKREAIQYVDPEVIAELQGRLDQLEDWGGGRIGAERVTREALNHLRMTLSSMELRRRIMSA